MSGAGGVQHNTELKVGAIFLVASASLLGAVPPLLRRQSLDRTETSPSAATYLLRAFTAGSRGDGVELDEHLQT